MVQLRLLVLKLNNLFKLIFAVILAAFFCVNVVFATDLTLVIDDLSSPILITHATSPDKFVVEKTGKVFTYDEGFKQKHQFLDTSSIITTGGSEQGLLSIAFHPNYFENGYLFIFYTAENGDNTLARLTVDPPNSKQTDLQSLEVLIAQEDPASNHNGGMLAFGKDGYLYLGIGDGGSGGDPWNNAQNLETYLGKMLRIDVNQAQGYSVPQDNPFVEQKDVLPEIWSYGLRNPWRHSFDSETGDIWIADVGQNKWEEIHWRSSDSKGGENYGWRLMEGNHCFLPKKECDSGDLVKPVAEYSHKHGCSVTGGYVYRGKDIEELIGKYVFGDFCKGTIWTIDKDKEFTMQKLLDTKLRISSFGEDAEGELYVLDYSGKIFKLVP